MSIQEQIELLKAVLATAAADGVITHAEKGVFEGLAARIGIGRASLDAMVKRAMADADFRSRLGQMSLKDPERAMILLVATARIDGEIAPKERELLVNISCDLGIPAGRFGWVYEQGIAHADELRKRQPGGRTSS